ncbi:MAG: 30S ribosomal protein S13 [Planctomycetota bacterium]|jgi:small subunit ribosomal protein S13|nr:MAG: small subunit ribosomal protein [Planctomycetota bacterium]
MPRIAGVDVPMDKPISIGLGYIYGIGDTLAMKILKDVGIDPGIRTKNLSEEQLARLNAIIDKNYAVEGALRRQIAQNIQRLKDINCYRGLRHRRGLPVRGQRTRSNARTRKGPRKTVAGKKSVKGLG